MTYERIKERYMKNYITDSQLERFKALSVITEEQYPELYKMKHPEESYIRPHFMRKESYYVFISRRKSLISIFPSRPLEYQCESVALPPCIPYRHRLPPPTNR